MRRLLTRLMLAALPVALACSSDSLSVDDILGPYTATTFTFKPSGGAQVDVIGGGGSMELTLFANGTSTGTLSVPASITGGTALLESMAGTFTFSGTTVTFAQAADTFVRDVTWSADGNRLICDETSGGDQIHVILTRT